MAALGDGVRCGAGCNRKRGMRPTCGGSEREKRSSGKKSTSITAPGKPEGQEPSPEESLSQKLNVLDE